MHPQNLSNRFLGRRSDVIVAGVLLLTIVRPTPARASAELSGLIQCHEALVDRSDGTSQKMVMDQPTPFVFAKGGKFYFVTDKSISTLDNSKNALSGKTFVVQLTDHDRAFAQDIEIRKDGSLGAVCCEVHAGLYPVAATRANLGPDSIHALKSELVARLGTVEGSYQNKDAKMNIVGALKTCEGIDFGKTNPVGKLLRKYRGRGASAGADYGRGTK